MSCFQFFSSGLFNMFSVRLVGFAYIDPATTSYLIQIGVGIVIAAGTCFGIIRSKIKNSLKRNNEKKEEQIQMKDSIGQDSITAEDLLGAEHCEEEK